jgi:hypothetical protein
MGVNPRSEKLEPNRLQHDRPTACVITHQCSSAAFVSLRIYYRNEKFGTFRTFYYINCIYFQNCVRKLNNLNFLSRVLSVVIKIRL